MKNEHTKMYFKTGFYFGFSVGLSFTFVLLLVVAVVNILYT